MIERIIWIVLDSLGIGALPDAPDYGDGGSDTLRHIHEACGSIRIPHLYALGLGKIDGMDYLDVPGEATGAYGRMAERSKGKDTITGHWEMSGIILEKAFPVYPDGFPREIIVEFERLAGTKVLGNCAASGTEIIEELGTAHIGTGYPIVYTSADSVFQIAAHEDVIPVEKLYEMCRTARVLLRGRHAVGRVVARPFTGEPGAFVRTKNRKDFSLPPPSETILDKVKESGRDVITVGKIEDIFSGRGISESVHTPDNASGMEAMIEYTSRPGKGVIFTNLVDFDMLYGHRNDPAGYRNALEAFDRRLPPLHACMRDGDMLIITADHGCDPTTESTDHSREYVPLLIAGKYIRHDVNLGTRKTFADIAASVAEVFDIGHTFPGESFMGRILDTWGRGHE